MENKQLEHRQKGENNIKIILRKVDVSLFNLKNWG
jgi:hypothetical protein